MHHCTYKDGVVLVLVPMSGPSAGEAIAGLLQMRWGEWANDDSAVIKLDASKLPGDARREAQAGSMGTNTDTIGKHV